HQLHSYPYALRVLITDQRKSYGAAKREIVPGVEHRQHRYLNNRAENSHRPTRQRERRMQGFKSLGHAQRFLAAHGPIAEHFHFRPRRHRLPAPVYRQVMAQRFQMWREVTGTAAAWGDPSRWRDTPSCLRSSSAHHTLMMPHYPRSWGGTCSPDESL